MKQVLLRWLLPFVVVFALVGNVAATGRGADGPGSHGHGSGGHQSDSGFAKEFVGFFENDAGEAFGKTFGFVIGGGVNFVTLNIGTFNLQDMTISIFNTNTSLLAKSFSFDDMLTNTFTLDPGKYFAFFTGKISSDSPAFYAARASALAVPEPAEWMMILAGVAMMGFVVSRRRNT